MPGLTCERVHITHHQNSRDFIWNNAISDFLWNSHLQASYLHLTRIQHIPYYPCIDLIYRKINEFMRCGSVPIKESVRLRLSEIRGCKWTGDKFQADVLVSDIAVNKKKNIFWIWNIAIENWSILAPPAGSYMNYISSYILACKRIKLSRFMYTFVRSLAQGDSGGKAGDTPTNHRAKSHT